MAGHFLFQLMPSVFRLDDALHHLPPGTPELVLSTGDSRRNLPRDGTVYLWEGEGRDLVGKGTVLSEKQLRPQPNWQHKFSVGEPTPLSSA
jgi:hypothetical protein